MIDWGRTIVSGIVAGIVFVMMEMLLIVFALGGSLWGPPRMMAAIVLGDGVLPPPATFDLGIVMAGMIVHFVLSIVYAVVLAFVIRGMSPSVSLAVGAAFGLALYLINFYGFTAIFPWFAMARNWVTIISHMTFGAVIALYYRPFGSRLARSAATTT